MKNLLAYAFNNICVLAIGLSFYFSPSTSWAQDLLDDPAELQYQQAVNDVLNTYDPQITQLNSQLQDLSTSGKQQCIQATREAQAAADAQAGQAGAQAMQSLIGPGTETVGHALESVMAGAGSEKATLIKTRDALVAECNSKDGGNFLGVQAVTCTSTTATSKKSRCRSSAEAASLTSDQKLICESSASDYANTTQARLTELNAEIDEVGAGMGELMGSGLQLAAAGFTGNMLKKNALEQAAGIKANAAEQEKLCDLQVNNQIQAIQGQLANLQAQKARDMMMARMSAEYGTRERRKQADLLNTDDDEFLDAPIAVSDPDFIPQEIEPDFSKLFGNNGGGSGGGGGGPAGGAAGSGGGDPNWVFGDGGGGGSPGGSPLPPSAADGSWSGQGAQALTGISDGGGFGKGFSDFPAEDKQESVERTPASVGAIGDGGLRVLLARSSIIHSRHASTLMKSLDLDKLANRKKDGGRAAASVTNSLK